MVSLKYRTRLAVYAPNGARLGTLDYPTGWDASFPWNDHGALSLSYMGAAPGADLLTTPCEVSVEVWDGEAWREPRNGRFIMQEAESDRASRTGEQTTYKLPTYSTLMEGVAVVPAKFGTPGGYDKDGKRQFLSATVGQILSTVLQEARSLVDGLCPGLELGFTPVKDSGGQDWDQVFTLYYEPGITLGTILANFAAQGACDWWMEGRTLHVVNTDSTSVHSPVTLTGEATAAPLRRTIGGLLHTVLLQGEEDVWRVDNPGAPTPWGTSMKVLNQGGVKDQDTARQLASVELEAGKRERAEYSWDVPLEAVTWRPLLDFQAGDWLRVPGRDSLEDMRVYEVMLSFKTDGVACSLKLNDRFEDAQVRNAKRLKGLTGGASGDAGTSTLPATAKPADAIPEAPVGLVAESEGYWEGKVPRSLVRASWLHSGQDINHVAISIDHFVVNIGGKQVETSELEATLRDFAPNTEVDVTVWAVSADGVQSEPARARLTTAAPDEIPDPPTQLTAECEFGIVSLAWDGCLQYAGGQPYTPPEYVAGIRIEESYDRVVWTPVDTIVAYAPGWVTRDQQAHIGETVYYRAVAVVSDLIESEPSPVTEVTVRSVVSEQLAKAREDIAQAQKDLDAGLAELDSELGKVGSTADGKNAITYSTSAPGLTKGKEPGDLWFQRDSSGRITGEYVWDGSAWNAVKLTSTVIASVDVGSLTAGTAAIDTGVINKLYADLVTSKLLKASSVITGNMIATNAVTSDKIYVSQALVDKILTNTLAAGKITAGMIASSAVEARHIKSGAITADHIAANTITGNKIAANSIDGTHIKSQAITADLIKSYSITATQIAAGAITADKIAARSITADKLSSGVIEVALSNYGRNVKITPDALEWYSGGTLEGRITSSGAEFWYGTRKIGMIGEINKYGEQNVRGIVMNLEYTGDFVSWGYKTSSSESNYTSMITFDPRGKMVGVNNTIVSDLAFKVRGHAYLSQSNDGVYISDVNISGAQTAGLLSSSKQAAIAFERNTDKIFMWTGGFTYNMHYVMARLKELIMRMNDIISKLGKGWVTTINSDGSYQYYSGLDYGQMNTKLV